MGLDVSHDCWHGAYSAFMRWRRKLAEVAEFPPLDLMVGFYEEGSLLPRHAGIGADDNDRAAAEEAMRKGGFGMPASVFDNHPTLSVLPIPWTHFNADPLTKLLNHSDCDGEIAAGDCGPLADRLETLLPLLPDEDGGGHVRHWRETTRRFIDGLRRASEAGESVRFH